MNRRKQPGRKISINLRRLPNGGYESDRRLTAEEREFCHRVIYERPKIIVIQAVDELGKNTDQPGIGFAVVLGFNQIPSPDLETVQPQGTA